MVGAANLVPDEIVAVARALRAGDVDGARELWRRVFPVIDALLTVPFSQAIKAGLRLRGFPVGTPREPLQELEPEGVARIEAALAALDDGDYLDRVENHLERLRVRYGIDFGRYYSRGRADGSSGPPPRTARQRRPEVACAVRGHSRAVLRMSKTTGRDSAPATKRCERSGAYGRTGPRPGRRRS